MFVDLALNVKKINQKGSKAAPGTARVVLMGVSRSPRVPSGGVRGGKPPRIIDKVIDQKHVYTRLQIEMESDMHMAGGLANFICSSFVLLCLFIN